MLDRTLHALGVDRHRTKWLLIQNLTKLLSDRRTSDECLADVLESWMYAYAQAEKGSTRCAFVVSAKTNSAARLPRLVPQTAFTAAARQDRSKRDIRKSEKASSRRCRRNDCTLDYTLGIVLRERQRWDTSQCHASLTNHRIGHFSARCFDNADLLPQDLDNMVLLGRNTPDSKSGQLFASSDRR